MNTTLRNVLLAMAEEDRRVRAELMAEGSLGDGYHPRMEEVHRRNASRLTIILDDHGWPGRSLVGEDGAHAAWFVIQHAIGNPSLQRRGLDLLRRAAERGEASARQVAYLEDRIRFFEGRPQVYGTQYDWNEQGQLAPHPIEEIEGVDERRRSVGLEPLAEHTLHMRQNTARSGEGPPANRDEHRRKFLEWAMSVGWRA